jgi:hypothetical protein
MWIRWIRIRNTAAEFKVIEGAFKSRRCLGPAASHRARLSEGEGHRRVHQRWRLPGHERRRQSCRQVKPFQSYYFVMALFNFFICCCFLSLTGLVSIWVARCTSSRRDTRAWWTGESTS